MALIPSIFDWISRLGLWFLIQNFCLDVYYHPWNFWPSVQIHSVLNSLLWKLYFSRYLSKWPSRMPSFSYASTFNCLAIVQIFLCACFKLLSSKSLAYDISYIHLVFILVLLKDLCIKTHMLFCLLFLILINRHECFGFIWIVKANIFDDSDVIIK